MAETTDNEAGYRLVKGLRVVRAYRPEPIDESHRLAILEAGRWTGSSKNRQGWRLVELTGTDARARLADCGYYTQPVRDAPWVVVLVKTGDGNDFDIGRLAQNLMLAAAAVGVGSCPVTLHKDGCAERELKLPDDHEVRWAICFGYPDMDGERHQRSRRKYGGRIPLSELVLDRENT